MTFSGKLSVLMIVPPDALLDALFVAAFGRLNSIWVIRHEEAVPYPAGTVGRHFARITKAYFAILVRDLCDIQVWHGGIVGEGPIDPKWVGSRLWLSSAPSVSLRTTAIQLPRKRGRRGAASSPPP